MSERTVTLPSLQWRYQALVVSNGKSNDGGSKGPRNMEQKVNLQILSNRTGLSITGYHFSPGSSKKNQIEHRMF